VVQRAHYEAEQDRPRRTVALKVIESGLSDPRLVWRFERELLALGRLQHPGIAQIYEAGTADNGRAAALFSDGRFFMASRCLLTPTNIN
jgi:serine/threonine protein kinase